MFTWYCWPLIVGAGGLIAGFLLRYATAIEQKQTVRTDYLEVINAQLDAVPTRTSLFRGLSSLASISSGASIGREGPMVQLSALAGSLMGRWWFKSLPLKNSDVVAMAAAAGLASVYRCAAGIGDFCRGNRFRYLCHAASDPDYRVRRSGAELCGPSGTVRQCTRFPAQPV